MSYEKHTWETGETITAEKLNNIENGIENNNFEIVVFSQDRENANTWTADKTLEELQTAYEAGRHIVAALRSNNGSGSTLFPVVTIPLFINGVFGLWADSGVTMSDVGEKNIELSQSMIQYLPSGISVTNQHNYVAKASLS